MPILELKTIQARITKHHNDQINNQFAILAAANNEYKIPDNG